MTVWQAWATPVFAPSVFICLLIALSIDYGDGTLGWLKIKIYAYVSGIVYAALFLLVRFREYTIKDEMSNRDAVFQMMVGLNLCVGPWNC